MSAWIFLALLAPFLLAITDTLTKKANHSLDEYTLAWFRNLLAIPVLFTSLFISGIPYINPNFWKTIIFVLPIELIVTVFYFRAIKVSPISKTAPFNAFSPLFISLGGFLFIGEKLNASFLLPMLLLITGAYIINLEITNGLDLLSPFRNFGNEKGPIYMILAGLLFGITIPMGKLMSSYSSPQFFTAIYFGSATILFTPIFLLKTKDTKEKIMKKFPLLILVGLSDGIFAVVLWLAYSLGPVGLTSAIGKLSILFTVIFAGLHLKEKEIVQKIIASLFMIAGAALIVIYS